MRHLVILLSIAFLLFACDNLTSRDSYQIATSTDGNVYRLNKKSGEIWLIKNDTIEKLQMKDFRLRIGQRYVGEDLYSFTYSGKGQTGEIKTLDDYVIRYDAQGNRVGADKKK